jgi:undecaprenyl-diphosphatase
MKLGGAVAEVCANGVDTGFVDLGYAKVAALGVVQGITELLPISSTAHMRVVPFLLGWRDPGSAFSAAMQLAALAAVVTYFWKDIKQIVEGSLAAVAARQWHSQDFRLAVGIVLATIPIVIVGAASAHFLNACATPARSLIVIGVACIVMSALLALAEILAVHTRTISDMGLRDALIVGIAQVGALIPGVSRSGSTLTAALCLDLKREEAARFSFLLGLPAIALAGLKELWTLHKAGLSLHGWSILAVGLVVASVSAFLAIWGLMRFLEHFSTWPFVVYRFLLGVLLLILAIRGYGFA